MNFTIKNAYESNNGGLMSPLNYPYLKVTIWRVVNPEKKIEGLSNQLPIPYKLTRQVSYGKIKTKDNKLIESQYLVEEEKIGNENGIGRQFVIDPDILDRFFLEWILFCRWILKDENLYKYAIIPIISAIIGYLVAFVTIKHC